MNVDAGARGVAPPRGFVVGAVFALVQEGEDAALAARGVAGRVLAGLGGNSIG